MDWIELTLTLAAASVASAEQALLNAGALAITLRDAEDQPLLEPAPGTTPLWSQVVVTGLFTADAQPLKIKTSLKTELAQLSFDTRVSQLRDRAWERVWLEHFGPIRFGSRLWVCPLDQPPPADDAIVLWLDPGLAFGTGTHPTTALCLGYLDAHPPQSATVIDYGCGTGILAIAALKLGARRAHGVDIDPQALIASARNADRNAVGDRLQLHDNGDGIKQPADLLLANIVAKPLLTLAAEFAAHVHAGGRIVLSGILDHQADAVAARFACDFHIDTIEQMDGWCLIVGTRTGKRPGDAHLTDT